MVDVDDEMMMLCVRGEPARNMTCRGTYVQVPALRNVVQVRRNLLVREMSSQN
jgi:hypothetical protein